MEGGNPKRRRTAVAHDDNVISSIIDLPIGFHVEFAAYLSKPSRALFAIAMTTATSDNNRAPLSSLDISNAIIASTQWDILDFGELERDFAEQLTDDHVAAILRHVDAPTQLRRLQLHGLLNITGIGLEILRGSTVLEQIDLRGGMFLTERGGENISDVIVIPILTSIISAEGNAFKHILGVPKPWEDARSPSLQVFVEHYNRILGVHATACNTCGGVCGGDDPWFGTERYGWEVEQRYTCQRCLNYICDENECSLKSCRGCNRKLCKDCEPCKVCKKCSYCTQSTLQPCVGDGCGRMICDGCNNTTCQNDQCHKTGCMECLGAKRCGKDDGCGKTWCSRCVTTFHCDQCRLCNKCTGSSFEPCPVGKCERSGNICQECIKTCRKCKATGCAKCLDYRVCQGIWHDCPKNTAHCGSCYNGPNCDGTPQVQSPDCEKCGHEFCQECSRYVYEPECDVDSCDYEPDSCYECKKEFCKECWRCIQKPDCDVDRCDECRKEMCEECWDGSWCWGDCNTCDVKMAKATNQWNGCTCTPDCLCWDSDKCSNKGKSAEESDAP
eukprot:scaffold1978_cov144-Skeletonema_menzelii.AAC.6